MIKHVVPTWEHTLAAHNHNVVEKKLPCLDVALAVTFMGRMSRCKTCCSISTDTDMSSGGNEGKGKVDDGGKSGKAVMRMETEF
jgi:hypothetical protein